MISYLPKSLSFLLAVALVAAVSMYWPQRFVTPPYNSIMATVRQVMTNPETPKVELAVQRVAGGTVTQRAHLAAGCYAISGKDFSECSGQMYAVQRDGSVVKSGAQFSNDPLVSPTGSYTFKFAKESTLKPKEEAYPGSWKTKLAFINREGKTLQSFDSKRYGQQFIDVTPLAYSQDEQHVFLQVWAMQGGDFIDQMLIVKQAVQDKSFEVIVRNPNPPEAISDPTVKNYTLSLFLGLSTDKRSMFVEEMKPSDGNYHPQLLYEYDFTTGKRMLELSLNTQGGFSLLFSPNQEYFAQQVDSRISITKVSNGTITVVKQSIPDGCNLNDLSNDGKIIAVTCDQNDQIVSWLYDTRGERRKLLTSWPMSGSGYKLGKTYYIFAGFSE